MLDIRHAVRALIIDDDNHTLLVKFVFPSGIEAWALPGGGLDEGETPEQGLRRELREELGLGQVDVGPHIWNRLHIIPMRDGQDGQRDQIHLVRIARFEPRPMIGWDRMNAEYVFEMRWWSLDEIVAATDTRFAPRRLGDLFGSVLADGPPAEPIDTGV